MMDKEHCELKEAVSFAIGITIGVVIAIAVLYFPLQNADKELDDRLKKIEKKYRR